MEKGFTTCVVLVALVLVLVIACSLDKGSKPHVLYVPQKKKVISAKSWVYLDRGTYWIAGKKTVVTKKKLFNLHGKVPWIVYKE